MVESTVEETERPAWLLKQVRDLTENWEIPLGEELEKYLDQVDILFYNFILRKLALNGYFFLYEIMKVITNNFA